MASAMVSSDESFSSTPGDQNKSPVPKKVNKQKDHKDAKQDVVMAIETVAALESSYRSLADKNDEEAEVTKRELKRKIQEALKKVESYQEGFNKRMSGSSFEEFDKENRGNAQVLVPRREQSPREVPKRQRLSDVPMRRNNSPGNTSASSLKMSEKDFNSPARKSAEKRRPKAKAVAVHEMHQGAAEGAIQEISECETSTDLDSSCLGTDCSVCQDFDATTTTEGDSSLAYSVAEDPLGDQDDQAQLSARTIETTDIDSSVVSVSSATETDYTTTDYTESSYRETDESLLEYLEINKLTEGMAAKASLEDDDTEEDTYEETTEDEGEEIVLPPIPEEVFNNHGLFKDTLLHHLKKAKEYSKLVEECQDSSELGDETVQFIELSEAHLTRFHELAANASMDYLKAVVGDDMEHIHFPDEGREADFTNSFCELEDDYEDPEQDEEPSEDDDEISDYPDESDEASDVDVEGSDYDSSLLSNPDLVNELKFHIRQVQDYGLQAQAALDNQDYLEGLEFVDSAQAHVAAFLERVSEEKTDIWSVQTEQVSEYAAWLENLEAIIEGEYQGGVSDDESTTDCEEWPSLDEEKLDEQLDFHRRQAKVCEAKAKKWNDLESDSEEAKEYMEMAEANFARVGEIQRLLQEQKITEITEEPVEKSAEKDLEKAVGHVVQVNAEDEKLESNDEAMDSYESCVEELDAEKEAPKESVEKVANEEAKEASKISEAVAAADHGYAEKEAGKDAEMKAEQVKLDHDYAAKEE